MQVSGSGGKVPDKGESKDNTEGDKIFSYVFVVGIKAEREG